MVMEYSSKLAIALVLNKVFNQCPKAVLIIFIERKTKRAYQTRNKPKILLPSVQIRPKPEPNSPDRLTTLQIGLDIAYFSKIVMSVLN